MVLFLKDYQFTFDFTSTYIPYKRKQEIRRKVIVNGGTISYILNDKTKFLVSEDAEIASTYKGVAAQKLGIPIVCLAFVDDCAKEQKVLNIDDYIVLGSASPSQELSFGITKAVCDTKAKARRHQTPVICSPASRSGTMRWSLKSRRQVCRVYDNDRNRAEMPRFPSNYEIIKHSWFKKQEKDDLCVFASVELHIGIMDEDSPSDFKTSQYRVFTHTGNLQQNGIKDGKKESCFSFDDQVAVAHYSKFCEQYSMFHQSFAACPPWIGSDQLMLNNLTNQSVENEQNISMAVYSLVHTLWSETVGELTSLLSVSVEHIKTEDIVKAEAALLSLRELLTKESEQLSGDEECQKLSDEFYSLIPHTKVKTINTIRLVAEKHDLCQLIKDMVTITEATSFSTRSSNIAKYRALRCHIEALDESCEEYKNILNEIRSTEYSEPITVRNIFSCNRPIETNNFHNLGNNRQLFHSSKCQNFIGILSRGLLLPKMVVEDYGGERTDVGHLGTGIYFAGDAGASAKYSSPGHVRGSRFMVVCDVALGKIQDYTKFQYELTKPQDGYDSCHGVRRGSPGGGVSEFEDDEYVVYGVNQQRIRYLVEFTLPDDQIKSPGNDVNILSEPTTALSLDDGDLPEWTLDDDSPGIDITDVEDMVDPMTKVKAGLQFEGDNLVPLQSVHIRAKLQDLCAKVVVMQVYKNPSAKPIEAKYVFPLDDMAAVCGFEAFINGKHIIGEVKEKEEAHREYKKAISEGHGAYLMDEETPDVFTVSVGNIPASAIVIIKISYVAELAVEGDNIKFHLPGSLAPWKRDQALQDETQNDVECINIIEDADSFDLSVNIAIEMPFDIRIIDCPTHKIKMKKTAAKAVIELGDGQTLDDGFQLLIGLAEIHVPRMWVEKHPEKADSQACMLSFYPEFEAEPMNFVEVIFLLDLSCSMQGVALENAKKVLLLTLHHLPEYMKFNIIPFGGRRIELFPTSRKVAGKTLKEAQDFVKVCTANLGASDLWKVLSALSHLPVTDDVRNIFIISDGHLCEEETTLRIASSMQENSRIFSFGVGASANRHFLRTLSRVGTGASEYFDPKLKSKWKGKVQSQLTKCQQPVMTSVSVAWRQHDNDPATPIQAPNQILSLFNGCRQVVYGFVPFCTQATLHATINGKEISTMVSTSELSMSCGKTLHQMTARALINDWDDGSLAQDHILHQAVKRDRKQYIIEISKEYSVTSKFTSFVAIEHRDENEVIELEPDIDEILDDEDVDILPYIGWQEEEESKVIESFLGKQNGPCTTSDDSHEWGADSDEAIYDAVDTSTSTSSSSSSDDSFGEEFEVPELDESRPFASKKTSALSDFSSGEEEEQEYGPSCDYGEIYDLMSIEEEESFGSRGEGNVGEVYAAMDSEKDDEYGFFSLSVRQGEDPKDLLPADKAGGEGRPILRMDSDDYSLPSTPPRSTTSPPPLPLKRGKAHSQIYSLPAIEARSQSSAPKARRAPIPTRRCRTRYDTQQPTYDIMPLAKSMDGAPATISPYEEMKPTYDIMPSYDIMPLAKSMDGAPATISPYEEMMPSYGGGDSDGYGGGQLSTLSMSLPTMYESYQNIYDAVPPPLPAGPPPPQESRPLFGSGYGAQPPPLQPPQSVALSAPVSLSGDGYGAHPPPPPGGALSLPESSSLFGVECGAQQPPAPPELPSRAVPRAAPRAPPRAAPRAASRLAPALPPPAPRLPPKAARGVTSAGLIRKPVILSSGSSEPTSASAPRLYRRSARSGAMEEMSKKLKSKTANYVTTAICDQSPPVGDAMSSLKTALSESRKADDRSQEEVEKVSARGMEKSFEDDEYSLENEREQVEDYMYEEDYIIPPPSLSSLKKRKQGMEKSFEDDEDSLGDERKPTYDYCPLPRLESLYSSLSTTISLSPDVSVIEKLFALQSEDGSWTVLHSRLSELLTFNSSHLMDTLKDAGAMSLGRNAFDVVCRLVCTVLVLAYLRKYFPSYFPLSLVPPFKPRESLEKTGTSWQDQTEKALRWVKSADKSVPFVCSRLQLGINWEEYVARKLLL